VAAKLFNHVEKVEVALMEHYSRFEAFTYDEDCTNDFYDNDDEDNLEDEAEIEECIDL